MRSAAGASVLANLPSKWSTPELTTGVLPAHAKASVVPYSINHCTHIFTLFTPPSGPISAGGPAEIYVDPGVLGISMHDKVEIIPTAGTASGAGESDILISSIVGSWGYASIYVQVDVVSYDNS